MFVIEYMHCDANQKQYTFNTYPPTSHFYTQAVP